MKNLFSLITCLVLLSSCSILNSEMGSGNVTKKTYETTTYNSLKLSTVFDVVLIPSESTKVIVETDDNLQQLVLIENNSNSLEVKMKDGYNIGSKTAGKIYVYFKELSSLRNASVGNLTNESILRANSLTIQNNAVGKTTLNITADSLNFENSAVGSTTLTGICRTFVFVNQAVGSSNMKELACDYLDLDNKAVGSTTVCVNKEAKISNSAVGSLDVYGSGVIKEITNNAVGKFTKH